MNHYYGLFEEKQNRPRTFLCWLQSVFNKIARVMVKLSATRVTLKWVQYLLLSLWPKYLSHLATRSRSDVVTPLCMSQWRLRYVSNEAPNDVFVERSQDVLVVRLHDILLEHRDDISRGRNNGVPSVRLLNVSNKSQMKHSTTSQWHITKTP